MARALSEHIARRSPLMTWLIAQNNCCDRLECMIIYGILSDCKLSRDRTTLSATQVKFSGLVHACTSNWSWRIWNDLSQLGSHLQTLQFVTQPEIKLCIYGQTLLATLSQRETIYALFKRDDLRIRKLWTINQENRPSETKLRSAWQTNGMLWLH